MIPITRKGEIPARSTHTQANINFRLYDLVAKYTLGIFFSKDRREEVIEVEEEPESATLPGSKEPVKLMMQGDWMRGCPEGNEQSFLFALYDFLSNNACPCPQSCGYRLDRNRSDFFALFVSSVVRSSSSQSSSHFTARVLELYRAFAS